MLLPKETGVFRDSPRARRDLEQLRARFPSDLYSAAVALLGQCADPDQALNLLERLTGADETAVKLFDKNRVLLHYVLTIFGQSYWLGETIANHPSLVYILAREKHLERSLGHEDFRHNLERFRSRSSETDPSVFLAAFRKREYVRIALRDMLGIATLAETAAELSALADVILECALQEAELQAGGRFGPESPPPAGDTKFRLAVLSLGKLGGNEVNYSSDLDLLYLVDGPAGAHSSENCIRLAQMFTDILCRSTPEGPVFRIDLRLRPHGSQGELTAGLRQALEYYSREAHDWELQALIKLRYSAGDQKLAREFVTGVQPRVYSANLNFSAIDTALRSRERVGLRRGLRGLASVQTEAVDVKLDRGGIRDIEFLVQCLQRVYGGEEKWLRSGGTLFSLQKLHDKGHISGKDFHDLTQAYDFLRRLEHRLQLQRGQQLHRLPTEREKLLILQRAMTFGTTVRDADELVQITRSHLARVSGIYDRIIYSQRRREQNTGPSVIPAAISVHDMSFEQVLERIAQDSPALHDIAARPYPIHTRRNLHRFLSSAMTSPERYAELLKGAEAAENAMVLLSNSDYLTDILVRHPNVIRMLDPKPAMQAIDCAASREKGAGEGELDYLQALDELRQEFRKSSFALGAQDVLAPGPAFQSMANNSLLADETIRRALSILQGQDVLAVFALGRLGTREFDIASDADLLFVRSPETDADDARATAEKLIHALAAYTREGAIFAVDSRLRPHGSEGELVVTPLQLQRYLAEEAQPWEALTYTKLRFIAGREDVAARMQPQVERCITELAAKSGFPQATAEMRTRLERSNRYAHSFKLVRGGFYDIDFLVSFLVLRQASPYAGNTLERLEHLHQAGFVQIDDFKALHEGALLYRTTDHLIRLVTGRARPELPAAEHARESVETLVKYILNWDKQIDLQSQLSSAAEKIREIFQRVLGD